MKGEKEEEDPRDYDQVMRTWVISTGVIRILNE